MLNRICADIILQSLQTSVRLRGGGGIPLKFDNLVKIKFKNSHAKETFYTTSVLLKNSRTTPF